MQKHSTYKSASGFTLIELLTSMAIIGVLAGVAIQQYSLYKIRGYDAHSKQALHDINLLCNAYWTDTVPEQECDLAKSKEYGFVQHSDVVATLPSSPLDTFCASAKHNSSPNTYSIDSVALISSGDCSPKCLREGCKSSYTVDKPPECTMALLQEHRANAHESTKGQHQTTFEVCKDLMHAGICSGWGGGNPTTGEGGEGCKAPDDGGEIAYALQRRKDIKSGKVQGESVEWLGYESLHGPEGCKGGEYYGGPGWSGGCADKES